MIPVSRSRTKPQDTLIPVTALRGQHSTPLRRALDTMLQQTRATPSSGPLRHVALAENPVAGSFVCKQ